MPRPATSDTTGVAAQSSLFGRELKLAAVTGLVRQPGGVHVVRGETGIGKSALLAAATARARADGVRVLAVTGVGTG